MTINYVLLDAARMNGQLDEAQNLNRHYSCLYNGMDEQHLTTVAPYLFSYQPNTGFATWLRQEGWGNSWGVFVNAYVDAVPLSLHFRKFKTVRTEDGAEPYFRFYDPRVLRIFLATCDAAQLKEFFGPIRNFVCEDEDPLFTLLFSFDGAKLVTIKAPADKKFPC